MFFYNVSKYVKGGSFVIRSAVIISTLRVINNNFQLRANVNGFVFY